MIPIEAKKLIKRAIMIRINLLDQYDDHDPRYWRLEMFARELEFKAKGLQRKAKEEPAR